MDDREFREHVVATLARIEAYQRTDYRRLEELEEAVTHPVTGLRHHVTQLQERTAPTRRDVGIGAVLIALAALGGQVVVALL